MVTLAVATVLRPAVGLAGILCLFGLKQWGQSTTAIFSEYREVTNLAVGVLVVVGVIRLAFKRSCIFCRLPASALLVAALYLYAFTTTAWAVNSETSLIEWATLSPYIVTIAILAPLLINDTSELRTAFLWTVFIGGAICFLDLVFGNWGYRGLLLYTAGDQTETTPLSLATMGGTVMLASSIFMLDKRRFMLRVIAAGCIPLALAIVLRSGSRGQLLALIPAFAVAGSIVFRLNSARSLAALLLASGVLIGLGWWASTLIDINTSRWTGAELANQDIHDRLDMASSLLKAALAHPATILFGIGNSSSYEILGIYPHITILEVIAEEGIPGTILYLAILLSAVRSIRRISRSLGDDAEARGTLAILAALFCFELILSWKQGTLLSSYYVFAYAIILGRLEGTAAVRSPIENPSMSVAAMPAFPNLMR
jgi:O-antigen ligase